MRLKIRGSHLRCKVANKPMDVREHVQLLKKNKDGLSLPLLSRKSSWPVKESKIEKKTYMRSTEYPVLP